MNSKCIHLVTNMRYYFVRIELSIERTTDRQQINLKSLK